MFIMDPKKFMQEMLKVALNSEIILGSYSAVKLKMSTW